jgi:hypothetical protein
MARSVLKHRAERLPLMRGAIAAGIASAMAAVVAAPGCAGTAGERPQAGKYPHRSAGCEIALYHTAVPGAAVWDDLGVAEVSCHVNTPLTQCMQMLKAEACRMGGDMIYNVPRMPLRPQDQVLLYRGQVAHTLPGKPLKSETDGSDLPPPASKEESAGPVIPLTGPAAPKEPGP